MIQVFSPDSSNPPRPKRRRRPEGALLARCCAECPNARRRRLSAVLSSACRRPSPERCAPHAVLPGLPPPVRTTVTCRRSPGPRQPAFAPVIFGPIRRAAWYQDCRPASAGQAPTLDAEERQVGHAARLRCRWVISTVVRRDLKLLLGANLMEVINAVFPVITCRKPANTILATNRQGKRKPGANHSHYKRLLGVARLLSQMAEPVMKGAVQISFLLARSFFVELCTAVLALLARVRVLTQQILLDVVSVYNKVTDLTDKKQAVKISIDKVQAFREYYPSSNDPGTILECVWAKDKFVLHEKTKASSLKTQDDDLKSCTPDSSIQYETLGLVSEEMENLDGANTPAKQQQTSLADQPDKATHCGDAGDSLSGRQLPNDQNTPGSLLGTPPAAPTPRRDAKPDTRKRVAFIAVGKTKVTMTPPETSSVVTKKQRVYTIRQITTDPAL
ncbi:uncharacterized protein [Triticum aestivum]|uniref:uncharacterized protein n=1 Tax=Triticum aestivum TaxID=4565 RepID=UPI001D007AE7|nr:uncharacterized protein LOC123120605 [Triticum aestivum]